jgi:hypothetical protein
VICILYAIHYPDKEVHACQNHLHKFGKEKISFSRQQVHLNIHIFNSQPKKEAKGRAFAELISNKSIVPKTNISH